jgi:hypothetical protein
MEKRSLLSGGFLISEHTFDAHPARQRQKKGHPRDRSNDIFEYTQSFVAATMDEEE